MLAQGRLDLVVARQGLVIMDAEMFGRAQFRAVVIAQAMLADQPGGLQRDAAPQPLSIALDARKAVAVDAGHRPAPSVD